MADVRDKDLVTEALLDAADDFARTDGASNGTRKIRPANRGFPHYAPRPGILSAGMSAVGTTQDNTGLAYALSNLTLGEWVCLPDWTPSATVTLFYKYLNGHGVEIQVTTGGNIRLILGDGTNPAAYDSTSPVNITDGAWAHICATIDRSGNVTFYVNGSQLGAAVSISSLSAQSATSTAGQYWLSNNGIFFYPGTLGECWIISGLLTATYIANIYRAGSIAPFCAYTANATTGQNVATINGLSFYQWLDFGQGYGPIIKDRSGNNQHALMGASGLTHAVPRNPPGIPARAPRTALVFAEATAAAWSTLNTQNIGTSDFTSWVDVLFPTSAAAGHALFLGVGPAVNAPSNNSNGSIYLGRIESPAQFMIKFFEASGAGNRAKTFENSTTLFGGMRVVIAITRSGSTLKVYFGLNGDLFDITNILVEGTNGTPPAWSDSINAVYAFLGRSALNQGFIGSIYDARLANVAMTEAQLRTEYERGEPGAEWQWGSKTNKLAGFNLTSGWSIQSATINDATSFTTTGAGGVVKSSIMSIGRRYRLTPTWSTSASGVSVRDGVGSTIITSTSGVSVEFTATTTDLYIRNDAAGTTTVSGLVLEQIGYTARLRTDTAAGLTAHDGSSNKQDFLFSTSGVTTSPNGRTQVIRPGTLLTFTSPGTVNLQLFGASCVDTSKKWRIVSVSGTANGAANLSLGSASGGAQYINAQAVTSGDFDISTFASRVVSGANLWMNSSATVTITNLSVILEETD